MASVEDWKKFKLNEEEMGKIGERYLTDAEIDKLEGIDIYSNPWRDHGLIEG